jgi:hypothetical protein
MERSRFAVPLSQLEDASHVTAAEQTTAQSGAVPPMPVPTVPLPFGDGATGPDADGD